MLKVIFRILFLGLGLFTTYTFGLDTLNPIWHRLAGVSVEGRISGFLAGRSSLPYSASLKGYVRGKAALEDRLWCALLRRPHSTALKAAAAPVVFWCLGITN